MEFLRTSRTAKRFIYYHINSTVIFSSQYFAEKQCLDCSLLQCFHFSQYSNNKILYCYILSRSYCHLAKCSINADLCASNFVYKSMSNQLNKIQTILSNKSFYYNSCLLSWIRSKKKTIPFSNFFPFIGFLMFC